MSKTEVRQAGLMSLKNVKRRAVNVSQGSLVRIEELSAGLTLPLLVEPRMEGINLLGWTENNLELIGEKLSGAGALLFRNFNIKSIEQFELFITSLSVELLEYSYRSTPRSHVSGRIYTSTEYPADQSIPLHNEMAYSAQWPLKLWFMCLENALQGGETPIADSRRVLQKINPRVRERFAEHGVMYVRNYGEGLDLSWQNVFQTEDKTEVEAFCRSAAIEYEWRGADRLRTRQVCQAVAVHPKTREEVWFNQAHLFHISSLQESVRESLLEMMSEEDLPRNAYYGDGSPIDSATLDHIREIYSQEAIIFHWQEGDVLMLDNMLAAHGRRPYAGSRKVVVGMAEPFPA
jgi:alpha-ketoglutarate-dependent taurine dioxygenase